MDYNKDVFFIKIFYNLSKFYTLVCIKEQYHYLFIMDTSIMNNKIIIKIINKIFHLSESSMRIEFNSPRACSIINPHSS